VATALLVAIGGMIAVSAANPRRASLGLLVALVGSPLLVAPPDPLPLLARLVGSALAVYLVLVALRRTPRGRGSLVGWPAEALSGVAAFAAGWLIAGTLASFSVEPTTVAGPTLEVHAASGAAASLVVVALAPILLARDVLRLGIGLLLWIAAVDTGRRAAGVAAGPLTEVAIGIALAVVGAAVAWTCLRTVDAAGSLALPEDPRRSRR
jgi:hypothetical protein